VLQSAAIEVSVMAAKKPPTPRRQLAEKKPKVAVENWSTP